MSLLEICRFSIIRVVTVVVLSGMLGMAKLNPEVLVGIPDFPTMFRCWLNIKNCIAAVEAADGGWRVVVPQLLAFSLPPVEDGDGFLSRVGVSRTAAADIRKLAFLTGAGVRGQPRKLLFMIYTI